jgi:hypothetical protein
MIVKITKIEQEIFPDVFSFLLKFGSYLLNQIDNQLKEKFKQFKIEQVSDFFFIFCIFQKQTKKKIDFTQFI